LYPEVRDVIVHRLTRKVITRAGEVLYDVPMMYVMGEIKAVQIEFRQVRFTDQALYVVPD
jgi:hypothetical protein